MVDFVRSLLRCTRGATAIEYGLIVALVAIAAIAAIGQMASKTTAMWNSVNTTISGAR